MMEEEQVYLKEQNLKDIGDALRDRTGTNTKYKPRDMAPAILGLGPGDEYMLKSVYDTNDNGIVDDAELVNGHTVESDVPANLGQILEDKTTEQQVKDLIVEGLAGFDKIQYEKVEELPEIGDEGVRYLIPITGEDKFEVWIYTSENWSSLGTTSDLNLDGYVTHNDLEERLEEELPKKQNKLRAGENITLVNDLTTGEVEISSENTVYTAGNENVEIDAENLTISTKDTTYSAGDGVEIDENNVISDIPYTAGENIEITDSRVIKAIIDLSNYYTKSQVDDFIANIDAITMRVVEELPAVGRANIIYLKEAGTNYYEQWVFSAGNWYKVGNTTINLTDYYTKTQCDNKFQQLLTEVEEPEELTDDTMLSGVDLGTKEVTPISLPKIADYCRGTSDIQKAVMPEVTPGLVGAVVQYIGIEQSGYKVGRFYKGTSNDLYAWVSQESADIYYTFKQSPIYNDMIYAYTEGQPLVETGNLVDTVSGSVMTDKSGTRYTRVSSSDVSGFRHWKPLESKVSDFENDGRGTQGDKDFFITEAEMDGAISSCIRNDFTGNRALVSTPLGKITYSNVTHEELNKLSGVTSNIQTQLDDKQHALFESPELVNFTDTVPLSSVDVDGNTVTPVKGLTIWNYINSKITGAASTITTSNLTANRALLSNASGKVAASSVTNTELGYLSGVTSAIQTQINDMWKKIYPVGTIYTTTDKNFNPATSFGGTWSHIGVDRVLWGVSTSTDGGSTLDEQLPDIRGHIDWKDGGQAKTEISNGSGAFNLTNKNLGAAYPTGTGSSSSARGFDFRASYYNSVYKLGGVVRPNAYTVHFWRRTA